MIVTDRSVLEKPCEPVRDLTEGYEIAEKIKDVLFFNRRAIGLAANQIGINKKVCVIDVGDKSLSITLINPKIIEYSKEKVIVKTEGCLSFPDEEITTVRAAWVKIETMNHPKGIWLHDIQAIVAQHEIDHLNGITFHKRQYEDKAKS